MLKAPPAISVFRYHTTIFLHKVQGRPSQMDGTMFSQPTKFLHSKGLVYNVRLLYHKAACNAAHLGPERLRPFRSGSMFSQASEGLLRKASVYAVRLLYRVISQLPRAR